MNCIIQVVPYRLDQGIDVGSSPNHILSHSEAIIHQR